MKSFIQKYSKLSIIFLSLNLFVSFSILSQTKSVSIHYKDKDYTVGHDIVCFIVKEKYYNDELLKKFKELNYEIALTLPKFRSVFLRTDGRGDILEHYYKFDKEEYIEKVVPYEMGSTCWVPNDSDLSNQWYLSNNINIYSSAWELTRGNPNLIIGVLDGGIPIENNNLSHPELQNTNRIILGGNFISNQTVYPKDERSHGTHVAGIIGAETNNGTGITGICHNSKLFVSRVTKDNGNVAYLDCYNGFVEAVNSGCKIINISLRWTSDNQSGILATMMQLANSSNVLVVAAAGNDYISSIGYPAKYAGTYSNVIAVSAIDANSQKANFSNYGTEVTVCAPGVNIYSTIPNYYTTLFPSSLNYGSLSGTSMATPIISGVAGLVWSKFPHLSAAQVRKQIELSADDLGTPGHDIYYGYGRVNAYNAVKYLYVPQIYPTIQNALNYATAGQTILVGPGTPDVSTLLTIPSGVTLEINGTSINFYYGLSVYGNLITNNAMLNFGHSSYNTSLVCYGNVKCNNTTFSSAGWQGISLYAPGTNNSKFDSCKIINVYSGSALAFYGSSNSTVSYCTISNMSGSGVNGIYASGSNLRIYKNKIQNNNNVGVVASSNSTIVASENNGQILSCSSGNNTITGNGTGISAQYSSYFYIDERDDNMFNNISGNTNANASAVNYSSIESFQNYWGGNPPVGLVKDGTSNIYCYSNLSCVPSLPFRISVIEEDNRGVVIPQLKKVSNTISSDIKDELIRARGLAYSEKFNEAMDIYKSVLSTNRGNEYTAQILTGILYIYRITRDKGLLEYLRVYSRGEENPFAKIAYSNALIASGYVEEALLGYEEVAKNNPSSIHAIQSLIQQSYIYYFDKNDIKKANEILVELEKIAEEDDIDVKQLKAVITNGIGIYEGSEDFTDNNDEEKETEVKVAGYSLGNYPNPFNPTTNIQFTIPKNEYVKLVVYDITGRIVKELVNGYKSAGRYNVEFNASGYASGIYYYKIEAGEYKSIQKMMLIK
jgi:subtilisin family serine protease/tetratricopeptide (TPR) repeat protein